MNLFVCGPARSGTTHLSNRIQNCCPLLMTPETHYYSSIVRGEVSFEEMRSLNPVEIFSRIQSSRFLNEFSIHEDVFIETFNRNFHEGMHHVAAYFEALCYGLIGDHGKDMLGEKTPEHLYYWPILSSSFPAAKFLFVQRDPRAVAASRIRASWEVMSTAAISLHWLRDQIEIRKASKVLGSGRCLRVSIEGVIANPSLFDQDISNFLKTRLHLRDISTNMSASWETWKEGYNTDTSPDRSSGWAELSERDVSVIEMICWREMIKHGYKPCNSKRPLIRLRVGELREILSLANYSFRHFDSRRRLSKL